MRLISMREKHAILPNRPALDTSVKILNLKLVYSEKFEEPILGLCLRVQ